MKKSVGFLIIIFLIVFSLNVFGTTDQCTCSNNWDCYGQSGYDPNRICGLAPGVTCTEVIGEEYSYNPLGGHYLGISYSLTGNQITYDKLCMDVSNCPSGSCNEIFSCLDADNLEIKNYVQENCIVSNCIYTGSSYSLCSTLGNFECDMETIDCVEIGAQRVCESGLGVCSSTSYEVFQGYSLGWSECYLDLVGYEDLEVSCGDSLDNDCDGNSDCDDSDCDNNVDCQAPVIIVPSTTLQAQVDETNVVLNWNDVLANYGGSGVSGMVVSETNKITGNAVKENFFTKFLNFFKSLFGMETVGFAGAQKNYKIYRSSNGAIYSEISVVSQNECSGTCDYIDEDLIEGTYYYKVVSVYGEEVSEDSNIVSVYIEGIFSPGTPSECQDSDGDDYDGYDKTSCLGGEDCNDNSDSINPGVSEICSDNIDNDCDGVSDCDDDDCEFYEACVGYVPPSCQDLDTDGYDLYNKINCPSGNDCDDLNSSIKPGATEICDDGVDNDCNNLIDCSDPNCEFDEICYVLGCTPGESTSCNTGLNGVCNSGIKICNNNGFWGSCIGNIQPGSQNENCGDLLDNDCDGFVSCDDSDCLSSVDCQLPVPENVVSTLHQEGVTLNWDNVLFSGPGLSGVTGNVVFGVFSAVGDFFDGLFGGTVGSSLFIPEGYNVYRSNGFAESYELIDTGSLESFNCEEQCNYIDDSIPEDYGIYFYVITYFNEEGESIYSDETYVIIPSPSYVVEIDANPLIGEVPLNVEFNADVSVKFGGLPSNLEYGWIIDGETFFGQEITYSFDESGNYKIILNVDSGDEGFVGADDILIVVSDSSVIPGEPNYEIPPEEVSPDEIPEQPSQELPPEEVSPEVPGGEVPGEPLPDCECAADYPGCNEGYICDTSVKCEHTTNTMNKGEGGICVEEQPSTEIPEGNSLYISCENNFLISDFSRFIGDVNLDLIVDQEDTNLITSIYEGFTFVSGSDCCVDVNNDGLINDEDANSVEGFISTNCFDAGYSCFEMENCVDDIDNDCDTLIDGEDPDCIFSCGEGWWIGDVNGEGVISMYDSEIVKDISLGLLEIGEICCADVNADGEVTSEDADLILQFAAGQIFSFPAGLNCEGTPSETYTNSPSGGSGGGGGSGGSGGAGNLLAGGELPPCLEAWVCDTWNPEPCSQSGMQTRICADLNDCGTQTNKPSESRVCPVGGSEGVADVTGEEGLLDFNWWVYAIWSFVLLVLIGVLLKFFIFKPKKKIDTFQNVNIIKSNINVDPRLINFIKEGLSKKYKKDELTKMLKSNGWRDEDINNAFNSIEKK